MKALRLDPASITADRVRGLVLTHDLGPDLRKGTILDDSHLPRLLEVAEVHAVALEPGDVHEDEAALRLAAVLGGPGQGVSRGRPEQSQVRMRALHRGQVRIDQDAVYRLNRLGQLSVFTLTDGQAVNKGEEVAGCKVTPVAVPGALLERAEAICRERAPVVKVARFRPLRTLVVVTERLKPKARELFSRAVTAKLGWYGAEVLAVREVSRTQDAVSGVYREAAEAGAELVLFAGASSIDSLDPAYTELVSVGGEMVQHGAPAHPGSMIWLGRMGGTAVLGVASCAGFGRSTAIDLVLPYVFASGQVEAEDLVRLGHGGLIEAGAGRRFPPYS